MFPVFSLPGIVRIECGQILCDIWLFVENKIVEITSKTHPLISPLCERLERWRQEIGGKTAPHLQQGVVELVEMAKKGGVESDLVIFVIALCEYWFRVCRPSESALRRALIDRLNSSRYTPYPSGPVDVFMTSGVPSAINRYVDRSLKKKWEPGGSDEMNALFRRSLLAEKERLLDELNHPFLASELEPLPAKQGGYVDWGPWVAATVIYDSARLYSATKQDSKPLDAAMEVLVALRNKHPDKSAFHSKRNKIGEDVPELVEALIDGFQKAKMMKVQDERILPFIDEDCFPSLRHQGGWELLVGKSS